MKGTVTWGDGHRKTRLHEIADITYSESPNRLVCACADGETPPEDRGRTWFAAATPEGLADWWRSHAPNTAVMKTEDVAEREGQATPEFIEAMEIVRSIEERAAKCTCATTGVERCPNYLPGDEAPDAFTRDEDDDSE